MTTPPIGWAELDAGNVRDGTYSHRMRPELVAQQLKQQAWGVWDVLVDLKYAAPHPLYLKAGDLERELAKAINSGDALKIMGELETVAAWAEVTAGLPELAIDARQLAEDYAATMRKE